MADRLLRETKPGPGYLPEIIPGQYWDQTANEGVGGYEKIQGSEGAPRVLLWGPDGSALMTAEKPGYVDVIDRAGRSLGVVSATNLDIALSVLRDAIAGAGAGAKTQADIVTSLAAILAKVVAAPATEAKQDTAQTRLNLLSTEATLAAVLAKIIAAPATEAKQDALAALVGPLNAAAVTDPALSASEIALLKGILRQLQGTGTGALPTTLTGSIGTVNSAPVVGRKTVTATAAAIFAGGSVKANRRNLVVRNEDPVMRLRVGPSGVTQQNGFPVEPGATVEYQFDPAAAISIFAISEGTSLPVSVWEV